MKTASFDALTRELVALCEPRFPGIEITTGHSDRWDRPCATFRCKDFTGLLPEERFHRLVQMIPADLREKRMTGFVWLELAEGETLDDFLALPRSEDIARQEAGIYRDLAKGKLFERLSDRLGDAPDRQCSGGFREMVRLLQENGSSEDQIRSAKLLMIRHRAYCDCQVLLTARQELVKLFAHAA